MSDDEQVLQMGNERLCVPEVLFTPSDIGLAQAGLVESIAASVALCPAWMQGLMYDNIVLVGGNARLPNFQTRVERELRGLVPQEFKITVRMAEESVGRSAHTRTRRDAASGCARSFGLRAGALLTVCLVALDCVASLSPARPPVP